MAIENPTFNLKTGADSDLVVAREVTASGSTIGKIKRKDGIFRFPYLARRTGDTITGTTENIESNELKHGRTKSAPRKGTSSSSGDINFELSPETFDDMLEAVFRGKWKRWTSDTESPSNKEKNAYLAGYFATKCASGNAGKKLIYDGTGEGDNEGLVRCLNNGANMIVHELNSETNDVKYSVLRKYGGQENEDLWQEFCHIALNTLNLNVEINSIITGSFGVMGTNNPKIFDDKELYREMESRLEAVSDSDKLNNKGDWAATTAYAINDVVYVPAEKAYYKCTTAHTSGATFEATEWEKFKSHEYISSIPDKATDTMQFTAREGFLYINGRKIQYAESLSFTLDNGLSPKYAIFVPNAISVPPLTLSINGDLKTYLVNDENGSKKLFNDAIADETIELLSCFQDKLEDPTALYVFQIFNAKHTENSVSGNGADTFDVSLPWESFNEKACRVFRIILPRVTELEPQEVVAEGESATGNPNLIALLPNIELEAGDVVPSDFEITGTLNGEDNTAAFAFGDPALVTSEEDPNRGMITVSFTAVTQTTSEQVVGITVKWHGNEFIKSFKIPAAE